MIWTTRSQEKKFKLGTDVWANLMEPKWTNKNGQIEAKSSLYSSIGTIVNDADECVSAAATPFIRCEACSGLDAVFS